ncbi:hypothetical protein CYMTET_16314 [Cymbomonas tetramitiformis]|uniref:Serine aminopeptidase S33 domain-containing protein n=1 Tax=Cymbomonas tetramitiformis TaxID=36881 RepID=A0AAE0GCL2_9CHLO|nr:hypothetical protein CYMTET_16314 [Cymbomonas tetramitiformis]
MSAFPNFLLPLGIAAGTALYYFAFVVRQPKVRMSSSRFTQQVFSKMPSLKSAFRPPIFAFNGHLQIILMQIMQRLDSRKDIQFAREHVPLKDGGEVALDWAIPPDIFRIPHHAPVVIILHTITGDSVDCVQAIRSAHKAGMHAVVFLRRGHLGIPRPTPQYNLLGSTADMRVMVDRVHRKHPMSKLLGIGISAGTGCLVRYLGEENLSNRYPFVAGACVCPGYDTRLGLAFARMKHGLFGFYDWYILKVVKRVFLQQLQSEDLARMPKGTKECLEARSLGELQENGYMLEGFDSVEEYVDNTNPVGVASHIKTPMLALNAKDDPVCVHQNVEDNVHLFDGSDHHRMLVLTERGSHCCYFEGMFVPKEMPWCWPVVFEYFEAVLESAHMLDDTGSS